MTDAPLLAVHVGWTIPPLLSEVLAAPRAPWTAVAADAHGLAGTAVQAQLFTSDALPRRLPANSAVWLLPEHIGSELGAAAVARLVVAPLGSGRVDVGDLVVQASARRPARPVLPFTRAQYRRLRGLPEKLTAVVEGQVVRWGDDAERAHGRPAHTEDLPTLFALCSCAVVTGERTLDALARACPVVTDPATADRLGLIAGVHVDVGAEPADRLRAADALNHDPQRAARLSQAGWATLGSRSPAAVGAALAGRFGFPLPAGPGGVAALFDELDGLGTATDALVRRRTREALSALPGAVTHGWKPDHEGVQ